MKIFLLISLGLFLLFANPSAAFAADLIKFEQDKFFLQTSGQAPISETVIIKNQTSEPLSLKLNWERYTNQERGIDFAQISLSELDLQPFAVSAIEVSFKLPQSLQSGDYYGYLVAKSETETLKSEFTLRFLGNLTQKVHLQDFGYESSNLNLSFENQGNITSPISGKITITNFFGQVVSAQEMEQFDIKASEKVTKQFRAQNLIPGPYQAKVELLTGEKKVNQSSVHSFWVEPVVFTAAAILSVLILFVILIFTWRRLRG